LFFVAAQSEATFDCDQLKATRPCGSIAQRLAPREKEMPGLNVGLRSSCSAAILIGANLILGITIAADGTLYSWGADGTIRAWDLDGMVAQQIISPLK